MIDGIPNRPKPIFTKRTLLDVGIDIDIHYIDTVALELHLFNSVCSLAQTYLRLKT